MTGKTIFPKITLRPLYSKLFHILPVPASGMFFSTVKKMKLPEEYLYVNSVVNK